MAARTSKNVKGRHRIRIADYLRDRREQIEKERPTMDKVAGELSAIFSEEDKREVMVGKATVAGICQDINFKWPTPLRGGTGNGKGQSSKWKGRLQVLEDKVARLTADFDTVLNVAAQLETRMTGLEQNRRNAVPGEPAAKVLDELRNRNRLSVLPSPEKE